MSRNQLSLTLRITVLGLLIGSTILACLASERIFSAWQARSAPSTGHGPVLGIFLAFMLALSLDRWWAVRRRAYSPARAFLQVAFAAALLTMLVPSRLPPPALATHHQNLPLEDPLDEDATTFLLGHPEPEVRGAACAMLHDSQPLMVLDRVDEMAQEDPDPRVRHACSRALGTLWTNDKGLGEPADASGP